MTDPISLNEHQQKKRLEGVEFLSKPSDYSMADEWYEFVTADHFWIKWRFDALKSIVPKGYDWGTILDVGCGNGVLGEQLEDYYGCKVCGCDLNLKALEMVSSRVDPVYFYNIHERHKKFEEAFSTILLMDVLEHIDEPVKFLESLSFHLRPGGRLIVGVPAIQFFYSEYDRTAGHVRRYNTASLTHDLRMAGFHVENSLYWGMCLIPLILIRKLVSRFCDKNKIIKVGFNPSSPFVGKVLDFVRRLERKVFPRAPIGTSLMIIARKEMGSRRRV